MLSFRVESGSFGVTAAWPPLAEHAGGGAPARGVRPSRAVDTEAISTVARTVAVCWQRCDEIWWGATGSPHSRGAVLHSETTWVKREEENSCLSETVVL